MNILKGFLLDSKAGEDVGHIALGLLLPAVGAAREIIQWPPDSDREPFIYYRDVLYLHHGRVVDAYRDFCGYLIGSQLTIITLIGLLIWRW